ncbi:CLUMA_CG016863, isoform A [Clunio marinus]|uniref:CLUMA_CG016863, isoform A n=1 Tax=Clunio marinus TaxID=568069 RepID=A0A1J1ISP7_9DIPT|nr:CLUMA_CG016863, isoform A [Clunio marinus]
MSTKHDARLCGKILGASPFSIIHVVEEHDENTQKVLSEFNFSKSNDPFMIMSADILILDTKNFKCVNPKAFVTLRRVTINVFHVDLLRTTQFVG